MSLGERDDHLGDPALGVRVVGGADEVTLPGERAMKSPVSERGLQLAISLPDAADYQNRNVIERRFCDVTQWRGFATRYETRRRLPRGVLIQAAIAWTRQLSDMP